MLESTSQPAEGWIAEAKAAARLRLPFGDADDLDGARRGRIGSLSIRVSRRLFWNDLVAMGRPDRATAR